MIAIGMLAALGQAVQDAKDAVFIFGLACLGALAVVGAVVLAGVVHDRRHGCKREHGPRPTRRERAVLKELETQGDLGHKESRSSE